MHTFIFKILCIGVAGSGGVAACKVIIGVSLAQVVAKQPPPRVSKHPLFSVGTFMLRGQPYARVFSPEL